MTKKIALGLVALVAMTVGVVGLSAFEAHVINVTAKIENALSVDTRAITFGTVFPQEELDRKLEISLSRSFIDEKRVDDIRYIIRQKPKCGVTTNNGTVLVGPTGTGEPKLDPADVPFIDCGTAPRPLVTGETWGLLPLLCEYISKHPDGTPQPGNDGSLNSFHQIGQWVNKQWVWNDVDGRLAKSENDIVDTWTIDLKVPCFGNHCAQDWEKFVTDINSQADPDQYVQPIGNEHKIFGCNLWIEVNGVSITPTPNPDPVPPPAPVVLSTTEGGFVIIAKTAITDAGPSLSAITGNVAIDPAAGSAITGVSCTNVLGGGTIYSSGGYTGGYNSNVACAVTDPVTALAARLAMEAAYTDAAGRIGPTATELGAGNIGGMTLAPGLYKWSTGVTIPTNVTLSGSASDVWIFQIAGNLSIASGGSPSGGADVVLAGGALAKNVFWQVGGGTGAILGTYSTFNGTILSLKQIIIQTGAVLNGRAWAQTQVTLDANAVSAP